MFTDITFKPVQPDQQYTAPDGTTYSAAFPKASIPGLFPVTLTDKPTDQSVVLTGYTINAERVQVWLTRAKTQDELDNDKLVQRQQALAQKWPDAFDLLDDVLARGIATVKTERDAIKTANPKPVKGGA